MGRTLPCRSFGRVCCRREEVIADHLLTTLGLKWSHTKLERFSICITWFAGVFASRNNIISIPLFQSSDSPATEANPNMSKEQARKCLEDAMRVLYYRDARSYDKVRSINGTLFIAKATEGRAR